MQWLGYELDARGLMMGGGGVSFAIGAQIMLGVGGSAHWIPCVHSDFLICSD